MSTQFIQRVVNYLANEVIIKGLANSKTFQKFAVRTDASIREVHKTGTETLNKTLEETLAAAATQQAKAGAAAGPPPKPLTGFPGFVAAFFKEIRKDLVGAPSK